MLVRDKLERIGIDKLVLSGIKKGLNSPIVYFIWELGQQ